MTGFAALGTGLIYGRTNSVSDNDPVKIEIIKEFVIAGHNNPDRVKEMLGNLPNLVFARYDWGNGDFEEAIEGAGHVGNREIAEYLIRQGARVNLFVLTMLGKTKLVKPVLEEFPELIFARGPHGFSLLHHAEAGGVEAQELYEFFESRGLKEMKFSM